MVPAKRNGNTHSNPVEGPATVLHSSKGGGVTGLVGLEVGLVGLSEQTVPATFLRSSQSDSEAPLPSKADPELESWQDCELADMVGPFPLPKVLVP